MYQCGFQDEYNLVIGNDPFAVAEKSFPTHKTSMAQKTIDDLKSTFKAKLYDVIATNSPIKAKAFAWYKVLVLAFTCSGTRPGRLTWHLEDYVWLNPFCRYLVLTLLQTGASSSPTFCQIFEILQRG